MANRAEDLKQLAIELNHPVYKRFKRRQVYSPSRNVIWSCDLIDYSQIKKFNEGYSYILICQDVFSKYVYAVPMYRKTADSLIKGFESLNLPDYDFDIERCYPKYILCDKGGEFYNEKFEKWRIKHDIGIYSIYSENKSIFSERFCRTIKGWLIKIGIENNSLNWTKPLQNLIAKYNDRKHSTTKVPPDVALKSEAFSTVHRNLYENFNNKGRIENSDIKVGDYVRIQRERQTFEKGYSHSNWTEELFRVKEVLPTHPLTYKLEDLKGENLEGSFYRQEILKSKLNPHSYKRIEKVLKVDRPNDRMFVKFFNLPKKFNAWVPLVEEEE
jgi:hypothetical protein